MPITTKHISVCICTYRRPQLLKRLLQTLEEQETDGLFTFSIVVADNDGQRSAEPLVSDFAADAAIAANLVLAVVWPQAARATRAPSRPWISGKAIVRLPSASPECEVPDSDSTLLNRSPVDLFVGA